MTCHNFLNTWENTEMLSQEPEALNELLKTNKQTKTNKKTPKNKKCSSF